MGGGFGAGRGQKYIDMMGETKLQRSQGSLRRSQGGMLTLKDSVEITHIRGISMDSLPSCWRAKEAGDRVFSRVGWGSRAHMVSELIHPHVATVLSIGKFGGAHGISLQSCRGSLLFLFPSFPFSFPLLFMQQYSPPVFSEPTQLG